MIPLRYICYLTAIVMLPIACETCSAQLQPSPAQFSQPEPPQSEPSQSETAADRNSARYQFNAKGFYQAVREVLLRHYRQATSHLLKNDVHFEHNTRLFIVHEATKTGHWQDPWAERGPQKDGIYCDISYLPGKYGGAALTPQAFDKRYFTLLMLTPYSAKLDAHLFVHLKYPNTGKAPEGFMPQMLEVINQFQRYAVKQPAE